MPERMQICHCEGAQPPKQSPASAKVTTERDYPALAGDCFAARGQSIALALRAARNNRRGMAVCDGNQPKKPL
ncbi:hypothetical protein A6A03_15320 [Chloroflexus islandicus]|uniref:Uncharacterized protein n=1 Tax=Chloroflexus islandicus TaxID=1707952 RepID=A0A178MAV3_9CHLR|nr:hypothetical protein A6A03_15320 [Chloroflexus islandicus]